MTARNGVSLESPEAKDEDINTGAILRALISNVAYNLKPS